MRQFLKPLRFLVLASSVFFFIMGYNDGNLNVVLSSVMLMWLNNMVYSIEKISTRVVIVFFNISFFTFLLGQYFLEMLNGFNWWSSFPYSVTIHTLFSVYLSLFFIYVGAILFEFIFKEKRYVTNIHNGLLNESDLTINIRKASKALFYMSYLFLLAVMVEKGIYVQEHGYVSLYTNYTSNLPSIVEKIGESSLTFFYVYLATMPRKKESRLVIVLYMLYLIVSLSSGVRGTFVIGIMVLLIYAVFRDSSVGQDVKWIGTKERITIIALTPFLIVFLNLYNLTRSHLPIDGVDFLQELIGFFRTQGGSINVISYGKIYANFLPRTNLNYTFGPLITYFTRGSIAEFFTGLTPLKGNTVAMALYGNDFGATITYLVMPQYYLNGVGLGTQYIAELYADFGYIGVALFNVMLGFLLKWIPCFSFKRWWLFPIGMTICSFVILMPRGAAMTFVGAFLSLTVWLPLFLTWMVSKTILARLHTRLKGHEIFNEDFMAGKHSAS